MPQPLRKSPFDNKLEVDATGRVLMPNQPAFDVAYSGTGYGTATVVIFDTQYVNVGGYYSTSTGRFTAPIAGSYLFYTTHIKNGTAGTVTRRRFDKNGSIAVGGSSGRHLRLDEAGNYGDNGVTQAIIYLQIGDYITVNQFAGSSYGTVEYDIFGGFLIG